MAEDTQDYAAFIEELTALSLKHRVVILGCGCCGSPFLSPIKDEESGEYAYSEEYNVEGNSDSYLRWEEGKDNG